MGKGRTCCVRNCKNYQSDITMHTFPHDMELIEQWAKGADRSDILLLPKEIIRRRYLICSKHFTPDCYFVANRNRSNLKHMSVPTLYLPEPTDNNEGVMAGTTSLLEPSADENQAESTTNSSSSATFQENLHSSVENNEETFTTKDKDLHIEIYDTANILPTENIEPIYLSIDSSEITYTEEAKLLLKMCRLCLVNPGKYTISAEEGLAERILHYFKIKLVETPNYAQAICSRCKTFLDNIQNFALKVYAANRKLDRILESSKLSIQIEQAVEAFGNMDSNQETMDRDFLTECFKCEICGECFSSSVQYVQHNDTHVVLYVCDEEGCGQKFSTESQFKKHLNVHAQAKELKKMALKQKKYVCPICKKSFVNVSLLKEHKETHLYFKCPVDDCNTILKNWKSFGKHMLIHSNAQRCLCQICGKSFHVYQQLRVHQKIHEGIRYKCDLCDVSYAFKSNLRHHIRVKHEGVRFYCSKCPNSYASKLALNCHEKMHSGKKAFPCNLCPKSFTYKKYLKMHILQHQGIKQYQCNVCLKSFVMKNTLQIHERIHVGEKFPCSVEGCGKLLTRIDRLRNHMKQAHPEQLNK